MADAAKDTQFSPGGKPETVAPPDELRQLRALWESHGTALLVAVAVALLAASAAMLYRNHTRRSADEAARSLASARNAQDLEDLITRRPSAAVVPLATLKLAKAYFDGGNYDLALAKYQEFGDKFPSHSMAAVAEIGRLHCQEAKGQTEEAAKAYREFALKHPDSFLAPQAVLGEARCLEALGRLNEARTVYEDFIAAKPESGWKPRAEELLEGINKKQPAAVSVTNASAPAVTGAPAGTNAAPGTN
jgi:tetratricopeptide (TPR) repeat protein